MTHDKKSRSLNCVRLFFNTCVHPKPVDARVHVNGGTISVSEMVG